MNARIQRLCAWSGIAMIVMALVGLLFFAGFVPPPSPQLGAQAVAEIYRSHTVAIRFGLLVTTLGAALLAPFIAVITVHLKRIEGRTSPLTYIQLSLGTLLVFEFIMPLFVAQAAAFRPERSAETVQALNDLCWLMFVGLVSTAVLQVLAIAVAILSDKREHPVFPRWAGYFNIWAALLFAPGGLIVFFKTGPLAWNGVFTFWIPLAVFGIWFAVMTRLLLVAIGRQEREESGLDPATAPAAAEVDGIGDEHRFALLSAEVAALRAELARLTAGAEGATNG